MTAELVRGQNHPLPDVRVEIRVSAGKPVIAGATLNDEAGRLRDADWIAHPAAPQLPGLEASRQAAAVHRLAVDLAALPEDVHRVNVLLALPTDVGGPTSFGPLAAPYLAVTGLDGAEIATYTVTGLDAESAVVALELYRRQDAWKVRAVGQGYAGGLAAMLDDQGLPKAHELAATINETVAAGLARSVAPPPPQDGEGTRERSAAHAAHRGRTGAESAGRERPETTGTPPGGTPVEGAPSDGSPSDGSPSDGPASTGGINYRHPGRPSSPAQSAPAAPGPQGGSEEPVAGDAPGWSMEERLYNQVWGMFEDLARTVAAYRSAIDFAESRMEREIDRVLDDPRTRVGPAADAARTEARAKHARLVEQAQTVLDRDLAQLTAEAEVVEPALPPALARWDNPVWHGYELPDDTPMALRLGDLSLPEHAELRIPMLVRLPLERGLWIDCGREAASVDAVGADTGELRRLAAETATAVAARLYAVYPPGEFTVRVIDPAGSAASALAPLVDSGALPEPPAAGAAGVSQTLELLTRRVDLVQMAVRSGATDALPLDVDPADQLLVVHDFPHGFDDRAVTQLRYLADEGPAVGVHLMMVADREDARAYGPVLDPLWRALLRLTPVASDHLADPWVGHAWTYEPPLAPSGSEIVPRVLRQAVEGRWSPGGGSR
ncbi:TerD family protein [Streptomyces sp. NPDC048172]|uniref:TerD family protein n=1 Tax=Streptomyces sp. NPDC048172 TaxID=3365505 RepID=UPI00370FDEB5